MPSEKTRGPRCVREPRASLTIGGTSTPKKGITMRRRFLAATAAVLGGILVLGLLAGPRLAPAPAAGGKDSNKEVFGLTKLWTFHLEIAAKEYEAMQPPAGKGFGAPPQPPKEKKGDARPSEKNLFGVEFPWAQGDLSAGGKSYKKVGLRYAG